MQARGWSFPVEITSATKPAQTKKGKLYAITMTLMCDAKRELNLGTRDDSENGIVK